MPLPTTRHPIRQAVLESQSLAATLVRDSAWVWDIVSGAVLLYFGWGSMLRPRAAIQRNAQT